MNRYDRLYKKPSCTYSAFTTLTGSLINLSDKREDFETITGFPASIGACPWLGADNARLSLLEVQTA